MSMILLMVDTTAELSASPEKCFLHKMARLTSLPHELLDNVAKLLDSDLLSFRLVCRQLNQGAFDRFGKKFFSRKVVYIYIRRSLDVLQGIARHDKLRDYLKPVELAGRFLTYDSDEATPEDIRARQDATRYPHFQPEKFVQYWQGQQWLKTCGYSAGKIVQALKQLPYLEELNAGTLTPHEMHPLHVLLNSLMVPRHAREFPCSCRPGCDWTPLRRVTSDPDDSEDYWSEEMSEGDSKEEDECRCPNCRPAWTSPIEQDHLPAPEMARYLLGTYIQVGSTIRSLCLSLDGPAFGPGALMVPGGSRLVLKHQLQKLDKLTLKVRLTTDAKPLLDLLSDARNVSNFSLEIQDMTRLGFLSAMAARISFHKLQTLSLQFPGNGKVFVPPSILIKFLRKHSSSLKHLTMRELQTNESFVRCLEFIRDGMSLKSLELTDVDEHSYKDTERACCHVNSCSFLKKVVFKDRVQEALTGLVVVLEVSCGT